MHIPDNYLSPQTCAVMGAAMVPVWVISVKKIKKELEPAKLPMLGIGAAFSFLGMMFNIPLPGGTTGHAVGGTMIAVALGPYAACISISIALLVQAFLFGDGGILSFGANCFNMAFVLPFVGYAVYRLVERALSGRGEFRSRSLRAAFARGGKMAGAYIARQAHSEGLTQDGKISGPAAGGQAHSGRKHTISTIAAGIGSYVGINAAALCAAIEFGIQPMLFRDSAGNAMYCPYPLSVSVPAMLIGHLTVFGAAEVVFTVLVLSFLEKAQPELFAAGADARLLRAKGYTQKVVVRKQPCPGDGVNVTVKPARTSKKLIAFFVCLIAAVPLGLLAEGTAWGEWGADEIAQTGAGYTPSGMLHGFSFSALIPDYSMAGIPSWIGYIFSAAIGAAVLIIAFKLLSLAVPARKSSAAE